MKKIILILVSLLLLVALPATIFLVGKKQELRKKAAPATTLSLAPANFTKKAGDEFTIEVKIDPGVNQVLTTELHLTFDVTKLQALSIANGPLFPNVLSSGVVESGAASITVGATSATSPVTSPGTVATLRMKALDKTDAPTSIRFAGTSFIGALGEASKNALIGSSPATITITDGTSSPSAPDSASLDNSNNPNISSFSEGSSSTPLTSNPPIASESAVMILSPSQDETVIDSQPVIQGTAPPGFTVTVTIYSTPLTCIAIADANGDWSCSPDTPLENGPHNVVVSAAGSDGGNLTASSTIFVAASGTDSSTSSPIPTSGNIEITLFMLALSMFLIAGGIAVPLINR